jgi:hypothetical protein
VRTILFSTEAVTVNTWETAFFLLSLLVFALAASGYVLRKGPSLSLSLASLGWVADRRRAFMQAWRPASRPTSWC